MLRITIRQMEAFFWAAELGTVNAASKHLFVSQPAVTARINELEGILGVTLFSRSQQGVQLTPAGRMVLRNVRQFLDMGELLERTGANEILPLDGVLRLGADDSTAAVAISEFLRQLRLRYPSMRVDLSVERSKMLHEKMIRRELDIALQTSPVARPYITDELLGHVQVSWVSSAHAEFTQYPFTPSDARSVPIVINPQPSILHQVARDWLMSAGTELHQLNTCNSLATIMSLVEDGHAIAALPVPVVRKRISYGTLKLLPAQPELPPIAYYVSYLAEKESSGVKRIVELAKAVLESADFYQTNI